MPKERGQRISNAIAPRRDVTTAPRSVQKVGRNELCPCESGKKYKDCHFQDGEKFLEKLERQKFKADLRDKGAPWYIRWFT